MERAALAERIDHTVLGPETTRADVERVLDEAAANGMNACVPPCYVAEASAHAPDVTLATVIGFPHGTAATATKREGARTAVADGADELDVVVNVGRLKAGEDDAVRRDVEAVVAASARPVKVIVEAALLDESETHRAAKLAMEAGADYLKTSTGFAAPAGGGPAGATVADVELLAAYLPVKAAGGIRDYETAVRLLDAGASRIGASAGVEILDGAPTDGGSGASETDDGGE